MAQPTTTKEPVRRFRAPRSYGAPAFACIAILALIGVFSGVPVWAGGDEEGEPVELPAGAGDSWWSGVQQRIQASEYEITWQDRTVLPDLDRAWHAPNRAHDLRTYFTEYGIRVVRRTESEPSWELGLSLIGYGRGETVLPVAEAELSPYDNRIDCDRGRIVEWYVNDPTGLEQGFTLDASPTDDADGPAYLVLALTGSLSPAISPDGQAIEFAAPGGARVLQYSHLKVTDAGGRELPAWMEGFAEAGVRGVRIVFDDTDAAYPVIVDPLLMIPGGTIDGNQASAYFGYSVSTAGDVNGDGYSDVIVGAHLYDNGETNEGRAYLHYGSAIGISATFDWMVEGNQADARLGSSVATAGDVNGDGYSDVVVGAPYYDGGQTNEGRVYVYHGSATGPSAGYNWVGESNQANARFGASVSTAGDIDGDGYSDVIVGARYYDGGQTDEGRAYVYRGGSAGLRQIVSWTAEGEQANAHYGYSVSTAGDVNGDGYSDVIVGAYDYDNGATDEGRAYVYHGSSSGLSTSPDWAAESDQAYARFGASVATAGDVNGDGYSDVIVGAHQYDNVETDEGRVYVYYGSSGGLSTVEDWAVESDVDGARFGYSASTAGDVNGDGYADVIVGAYFYNNGETNEGGAFIFSGSANGLSHDAVWGAEGDQAEARLGFCVSTAGDVNGDGYSDVIIGAYYYTDDQAHEGRAFVHHGATTGLSDVAGWTAEANQAYAYLGYSAATAGDVNGDGYADVIVGAYRYDHGEEDEGRAFVYHGGAAGLAATEAWSDECDQVGCRFGVSVSTAGDVNGDGYDDVIVGSWEYDNGEEGEGRASVYHGSPAGLSEVEAWSAEGDQEDAYFGYSVATAGDVNGDGYSDVIVGAYHYFTPPSHEGLAFVYHGSATGLSETEAWSAGSGGNQTDSRFGWSVATAGDVNGDGYADVVVGAPHWDDHANGMPEEGRACVFFGSPSGLSSDPDWTMDMDQIGVRFGWSVSTAGDVNGDGYSDIIVGGYRYDNGEEDEGRAFVYHGSSSGPSTTPDWVVEGNQSVAYFGARVSTAGDVNGDGYADVVVAAPFYNAGELNEGRVYVYHGSAAGLATTPDWVTESNQAEARFGDSVSTAGDVNGDGYADVVVGAYRYDNGETSEGRVWLYYGGGGRGLSLVPRQWQPSDDVPIGPLGRSDDTDRFRVRMRGRTPFGGGRAKLEWEVKPLGTLFDGSATQAGTSWEEVAGSTVWFTEQVTDLATETPYHWRVRLRYDGTNTPYQQFSRWVTVPRNGWNETDLRTRDADGDGVPAAGDCDNGDPTVWSIPGEAGPLVVAGDKQTFSWDPPSSPGGVPGSLVYDLLRAPRPDDFITLTSCVATNTAATSAVDGTTPVPGKPRWYLVRAENACGAGSLGRGINLMGRVGRNCP